MTAVQISVLQRDLAREILDLSDWNMLLKIKEYLLSLRGSAGEDYIAPPYTMEELDERLDVAEDEVEGFAAKDVFTELEQKHGWA